VNIFLPKEEGTVNDGVEGVGVMGAVEALNVGAWKGAPHVLLIFSIYITLNEISELVIDSYCPYLSINIIYISL
jgi:hypothetical protein